MQIHPLPPERFHELPIEVNPQSSVVIVAEDEDTHDIKGYWIGQLQAHIEPIWLAPDIRDSGFTALRMYAAMLAMLNVYGIKTFYAFADQPQIADYLERLGLKLTPYVTYVGVTPECPLSSLPQPSEQAEPLALELSPDPAPKA